MSLPLIGRISQKLKLFYSVFTSAVETGFSDTKHAFHLVCPHLILSVNFQILVVKLKLHCYLWCTIQINSNGISFRQSNDSMECY